MIKALFFDVGGTIFDWKNTAREQIQALAQAHGQPIDGEAFAYAWREAMFEIHTQVRHGNLPWLNSDEMHLRALENMADRFPLLNHIDRRQLVAGTWHHLKTFAGAPETINRLRTKYTVVVLTILNWQSVVSSSKRANVQWDGILSCEFLGHYKPSLQAYRKGISLLSLEPEEAMMVAAHKGDLAAAQMAGMRTAYVNAPEKDSVTAGFGDSGNKKFDIEAEDYETLCQRLQV